MNSLSLRPVVNGVPCDFVLEEDHCYVFSNFDDVPAVVEVPNADGEVYEITVPSQELFVWQQ